MKRISKNELARVEGGLLWLPWLIRAGKYIGEFLVVDVASNPRAAADAFSDGFRDGIK